jgi:uncharacterized membrane protein YqjE
MGTQRGILPLLLSMFHTRLELAAVDVESHVQATLLALMTAFVAVVLGLMAFAFIGIAVIVFFWETQRIAAAAGVMFTYAALAAVLASRARARWRTRPSAFEATVRELELDAEAFRGRL